MSSRLLILDSWKSFGTVDARAELEFVRGTGRSFEPDHAAHQSSASLADLRPMLSTVASFRPACNLRFDSGILNEGIMGFTAGNQL